MASAPASGIRQNFIGPENRPSLIDSGPPAATPPSQRTEPKPFSRCQQIVSAVAIALFTAAAVLGTLALTGNVLIVAAVGISVGLIVAVAIRCLLRKLNADPNSPTAIKPPSKAKLKSVGNRDRSAAAVIQLFEVHKRAFFSFFREGFYPKNFEELSKDAGVIGIARSSHIRYLNDVNIPLDQSVNRIKQVYNCLLMAQCDGHPDREHAVAQLTSWDIESAGRERQLEKVKYIRNTRLNALAMFKAHNDKFKESLEKELALNGYVHDCQYSIP